MSAKCLKLVFTFGLVGLSTAALAGEPNPRPPQEPVGFISGAVIGAFAGGPVGAVVGAGLGTWLGNRVHRASDAKRAEVRVAMLTTDKAQLQIEKSTLTTEKNELAQANHDLSVKLTEQTQQVEMVQGATADASEVLNGLQGDVLFRTGSAEITPDIAHQIQVLAQAVAKSAQLKIRIDGYADPRGAVDTNFKLSQDRADAVRDLLLASGVDEQMLEVNAYGKSQSTADDNDGYALERRVRLTLQMDSGAAIARVGDDELAKP